MKRFFPLNAQEIQRIGVAVAEVFGPRKRFDAGDALTRIRAPARTAAVLAFSAAQFREPMESQDPDLRGFRIQFDWQKPIPGAAVWMAILEGFGVSFFLRKKPAPASYEWHIFDAEDMAAGLPDGPGDPDRYLGFIGGEVLQGPHGEEVARLRSEVAALTFSLGQAPEARRPLRTTEILLRLKRLRTLT